jgi:hypothetical protein
VVYKPDWVKMPIRVIFTRARSGFVPFPLFGLFIVLSLILLLCTCTLDLEIPEYSLEFDGEILYDPTVANVIIYYTFIAEEASHPCT